MARKFPKIKLPSRLEAAVQYIGYASFFVASLVIFSYLTFPYERVRDYVQAQVSARMPGAELDIVSLSPWRISGVHLEGVRLKMPPSAPGARPAMLVLSDVYARAGIWSALFGEIAISFEVHTDGDGLIEGNFAESADQTRVEAHLTDVDLRRIGLLQQAIGLPLEGKLGGEINLVLAEPADQSTGTIDIRWQGAAVGDGRSQLQIPNAGFGGRPLALTIERLAAGEVVVRGKVEAGVFRIEEMQSTGDDAALKGQGTIRFMRPITRSMMDLVMRAEIKQGYRERNDRTKAMFDLVGMTAQQNPMVGAFMAPDGAFQFRLQGPLVHPVAMPAGSARF